VLKDDYKITEKNIDDILKHHNINSKNLKNLFNPVLYNNYNTDDNLKFKPEINKKSKMIVNEKEAREKEKNKSTDMSRSKSKDRIELELYKDAVKRKEKLKKIEYNNTMEILLNASKTKISNNSHRIAINKIEKIIDAAISKYEKELKKLSFIELGEVLTDLKIFREIFPNLNKEEDIKNIKSKKKYQNYKDIKLELNNIKEQEKRKRNEVDFYEQLWIILNPENKEFIKSDILSEFLKILFSPVASSVKEISAILKQFLLAAFFLNSNNDNGRNYISPLTDKTIKEEEIWPLEKLVKEFLHLKENILAYQGIKNMSKTLIEEMEKYKKEKLNFQPNANMERVYKSRSNFFQERIPALLERNKLRQQVLEEMKKESELSVNLIVFNVRC
jgi:hypothetical protein